MSDVFERLGRFTGVVAPPATTWLPIGDHLVAVRALRSIVSATYANVIELHLEVLAHADDGERAVAQCAELFRIDAEGWTGQYEMVRCREAMVAICRSEDSGDVSETGRRIASGVVGAGGQGLRASVRSHPHSKTGRQIRSVEWSPVHEHPCTRWHRMVRWETGDRLVELFNIAEGKSLELEVAGQSALAAEWMAVAGAAEAKMRAS